jgi:branched-chain amino acid transport system permease protein
MSRPRSSVLLLVVLLLLLASFPLWQAFVASPAAIGLLTRIFIYAIAAVSLDLIMGYGAMVSFGHAMFFGLGGYVVAIISYHTFEGGALLGWSGSNAAVVVWPLAVACCGVLGLISGYLALRTSGVQFIMITLAFAQLVFFLLISLQSYGGDDGLMMTRRNALPLLDAARPETLYYVALGALALWTSLCAVLVRSRFGLVLQALRQSERRVVNVGLSPTPYRLTAFVISAMGTGLAGVLWANYAKFVTPDMVAWTKSGEFIAIVVMGGLGTLIGPILGAAVFICLEQMLSIWTEHWMIIMGPVLVLIALFGQRGIIGVLMRGRHAG